MGTGDTSASVADVIENTSVVEDLPPISATFNEPMDGTSLNSATFTVRDSNGNDISGTITLASDNKTATFTPLSQLVYSSEYMATINTGAKDLAGNPLPAAREWSFLTPDIPNVISNVADNQSEDVLNHYSITADAHTTNVNPSEDILPNETSIEVGLPPTYPEPRLQMQPAFINNISSSTDSAQPITITKTTAENQSLAGMVSSATTNSNNFAGSLNLSSTLTPLANTSTEYSSIPMPEQKETKAGFTDTLPSNQETISALQQYQNNLLPYQQYYQYPPQQLYQNQQFSYPPNSLTNNYNTNGMEILPSSEDTATVLQQPASQRQLPPSTVTETQVVDISPPETLITSAVDNNGLNVPSETIVSSQFITLMFEAIDDSGYIVEYLCSYNGQASYPCESPFIIDNSLALTPTDPPTVPNSINHMLLISSVDFLGNIDQTPASFFWSVGPAQETFETIPTTKPTPPASPIGIPQTEPPFSLPLAEYATQASEYNNNDFTALGSSNSIPPTSSIIISPSEQEVP